MKKALITGITGQDGSHLAELLLEKGYEVHGIIRRSSSFNTGRIDHIYPQLKLYYGDVTDTLSLEHIIQDVKPDEIYNLAAQSHVAVSFELPEYTGQVDALGVLRLLETVRKYSPKTRIYQASTSELFGKVQEVPQKETTPFYPRSPYGVAKLYAYWICKNYRESYNMFVSNGILFNHEGERRGETFVTRKITKGLINWKMTHLPIRLGNLNAKRDWGYAKDFVYGMWLMLQQNEPGDFILATGEAHSNREFVEEACNHIGVDIEWRGEGIHEIGVDKNSGDAIVVQVDPRYLRPSEVDLLLGDPTKAKEILGWEPKTKFKDLVKLMMEHDMRMNVGGTTTPEDFRRLFNLK
jgi:GDPmannose 4,6-dehydratase